ncbi:MAG: FkbM family methyltransferase, partial [Gallionellaceae bacterium]|nr:FkbM family methyltransferase [Gallionellaceae bacterium]
MTRQQDSDRILSSPSQRFAWWLHMIKARLRRKEAKKVAYLGRHVPPGGVILDIGAHFGYFSKEFCRLHNHSCHVYGFEPVSYTRSILELVTRSFGNFSLHSTALSDANGEADIQIPIKKSGHIGIGLSHLGEERNRDFISETITTLKLDTFMAATGLTRIDFIKCDVEGAELAGFKGGANAIATFRPTVFCEVNDQLTQR